MGDLEDECLTALMSLAVTCCTHAEIRFIFSEYRRVE